MWIRMKPVTLEIPTKFDGKTSNKSSVEALQLESDEKLPPRGTCGTAGDESNLCRKTSHCRNHLVTG